VNHAKIPKRDAQLARSQRTSKVQNVSSRLRLATITIAVIISCAAANATGLSAGAAKVDITNVEAGPVNDPLYVKALVIKSATTTIAIVTVDAVAIGEIGHIGNDYLTKVRAQIQTELGIAPENVIVNASHCHGVVRADVDALTVQAVKEAAAALVPVTVGVGRGHEDRISENRRFLLKDGREADSRHAYSIPFDSDIAGVGPIDPEIGLLRLDKENGDTVAIIYNFACHPIQGVPSGGNTADLTGYASKVIEDNLSEGAVALFVQGCAGDINPAMYKDVNAPRNAEHLGNMLALSALQALKRIDTKPDPRLVAISETIALPRADNTATIADMEAERMQLLDSLQGTSLNFKTFVPLYVKYSLSEDFPSYYAHRYLHEEMMGREDLKKLDAENRRNMDQYIKNIHTMERLTRLQTNLALLRKHQANNAAAGKPTVDVEVSGMRIGDFVLLTFPGELTVQIGMNIKKASPHPNTFVAGYTNGYIYYAPTADQLCNVGGAQEDSDCIVAPEWQPLFEKEALKLLGRI